MTEQCDMRAALLQAMRKQTADGTGPQNMPMRVHRFALSAEFAALRKRSARALVSACWHS